MKKIAVIGAGIAGMSAAYYLSRKHLVYLIEKRERLGGHTNTLTVDSSSGRIPVDTGFIVHNERTYPNLVRLFRELGVATQNSDMSFAVRSSADDYEYSSRGLSGFFAKPATVVQPSHLRLMREILRFNKEAVEFLDRPGNENLTLAELLDQGRYSEFFRRRYLYPMASAVWSMSFGAMESFPAATLIRFFHNHGMLTVNGHPQWKTVVGGSNAYIDPITAPYSDRVLTGADIRTIRRSEEGVEIEFEDRPTMNFDDVVLACHGDQVLPLLDSPTDEEREVFGRFRTSRNPTVLHTDTGMLPRRRKARASWNYNIPEQQTEAVTVTYDMNRLQSLDCRENFCVTLNANGELDRSKVIESMIYDHPLYDREAIGAQTRWNEVSGRNRTHYCGAYWFYGFHEDGLNSGLRVANSLGVEC